MVLGRSAPAVKIRVERLGLFTGEVGDEVSAPWAPTSTCAMMRSTRLQLAAPSRNSLNLRTLFVFGDASKRAVVRASRSATCLRRVVVGATPRMKSTSLARHQSMICGLQ